jgi:hypothetical protein
LGSGVQGAGDASPPSELVGGRRRPSRDATSTSRNEASWKLGDLGSTCSWVANIGEEEGGRRQEDAGGRRRGRSGRPAPGKKCAAGGGTGGRRCGVPATSTWTCGGAGRHREAWAGTRRRGHRRPPWRRAPTAVAVFSHPFLYLLLLFMLGSDVEDLCVIENKIQVFFCKMPLAVRFSSAMSA